MSNVIRKTLIESKIEVLESLQVYLCKELDMYRAMLEKELEETTAPTAIKESGEL